MIDRGSAKAQAHASYVAAVDVTVLGLVTSRGKTLAPLASALIGPDSGQNCPACPSGSMPRGQHELALLYRLPQHESSHAASMMSVV